MLTVGDARGVIRAFALRIYVIGCTTNEIVRNVPVVSRRSCIVWASWCERVPGMLKADVVGETRKERWSSSGAFDYENQYTNPTGSLNANHSNDWDEIRVIFPTA